MKIPFDSFTVLNKNNESLLVGFDTKCELLIKDIKDLVLVDSFLADNKGQFIFCTLNYNLKNHFLSLDSSKTDPLHFPLVHLWVSETVVEVQETETTLLQGQLNSEKSTFLEEFLRAPSTNTQKQSIPLLPRTSKEHYLKCIEKIKDHIQFGDIYEVNYCQEFFAENTSIIDPVHLFKTLDSQLKSPFSAFIYNSSNNIYCFSPERFIKKENNTIYSEPIKGTAGRGMTKEEDEFLISNLKKDPKEVSENVMIVDLVRNDLSKIAQRGSVHVDALCEIRTYPTVHQMVSKISCSSKTNSFTEILEALFPMGSMTGVPKKRALELMDEYEDFNRGLYSGSIGYMDAQGNFDFNVVIRSILENKEAKYVSCSVGSAITINCDPENEYEECMVKIGKILQTLHAS